MGRAGFYQCLVTRMITKALVAVAAGAALLAALVSANGIHDAKGNIIKGLAESELIMGRSGKLGDTPPSIEYWANKDPATRGPPRTLSLASTSPRAGPSRARSTST